MEDYSYGPEDDLTTEISLEKIVINNVRLFKSDLTYVRDNKDDNSLEEFYALSGVYNKRIGQTFLPGNLFFEAEANSSLNLADGVQVRRPPSYAFQKCDIINRNIGPNENLGQSFSRISSFVNSENTKAYKEFMFQYGASSTISVPFYQRKYLVHQLFRVYDIL